MGSLYRSANLKIWLKFNYQEMCAADDVDIRLSQHCFQIVWPSYTYIVGKTNNLLIEKRRVSYRRQEGLLIDDQRVFCQMVLLSSPEGLLILDWWVLLTKTSGSPYWRQEGVFIEDQRVFLYKVTGSAYRRSESVLIEGKRASYIRPEGLHMEGWRVFL